MRREYLNHVTGEILTDALLVQYGAPKDLGGVGIFPLEHPAPTYDSLLQKIVLGGDRIWEDGKYIQPYDVVYLSDEQLESNLQELSLAKAKDARDAADSAMSEYMSHYSDIEKMTFPEQRAEVKAYQQDNSVATPVVDMLASERGITREEQLARTIARVEEFDEQSARIVGKQQGYEDTIDLVANDSTQSLRSRIIAIRDMVFDYS